MSEDEARTRTQKGTRTRKAVDRDRQLKLRHVCCLCSGLFTREGDQTAPASANKGKQRRCFRFLHTETCLRKAACVTTLNARRQIGT